MMLRRLEESFKEALNRQWAQCSTFFTWRRRECSESAGVLRDEGRGNAQPHRIEWNSSSTEFGL